MYNQDIWKFPLSILHSVLRIIIYSQYYGLLNREENIFLIEKSICVGYKQTSMKESRIRNANLLQTDEMYSLLEIIVKHQGYILLRTVIMGNIYTITGRYNQYLGILKTNIIIMIITTIVFIIINDMMISLLLPISILIGVCYCCCCYCYHCHCYQSRTELN